MPSRDYAFITPLLGADEAWSGYYVEFTKDCDQSAALQGLLSNAQLADFDQRHPWLIPVGDTATSDTLLNTRAVHLFPAKTDAAEQEKLQPLEAALRQNRKPLGLIACPETRLPGTGTWDYLVIAASHARSLPPFAMQGVATRTTVVATDVHSHADRDWLRANACSLSTCEFLLSRAAAHGKADMTRLKLLKLLALIDDDANTNALESVFREEAKLSYSLLRLVNSAALAPPTRITSYAQAINLLGRRQLQRWLQLLVYSDPNNGQHPTPLLPKAAARGHLLESLLTHVCTANGAAASDIACSSDTAFMIGTFSLLDILLNIAMPDILHQLPLPEIVQRSLLAHDTLPGKILAAIDAAEKRDLATAAQRLQALSIDADVYLDAQLAAHAWAAKIRLTG